MQREYGAPLSEHERRVLKEYEAEAEIPCQLVVLDKAGDPEVRCFADGRWLLECRFCKESTITCDRHTGMVIRMPGGARCKHCNEGRDAGEDLFVVRPLPAGVL